MAYCFMNYIPILTCIYLELYLAITSGGSGRGLRGGGAGYSTPTPPPKDVICIEVVQYS